MLLITAFGQEENCTEKLSQENRDVCMVNGDGLYGTPDQRVGMTAFAEKR